MLHITIAGGSKVTLVNEVKIILASGSPRRRQLLTGLGVEFEAISMDVDESFDKNMDVDEIAKSIASKKAYAAADNHNDCAIIAADTIVVMDDMILEKPKDRQDAIDMLKMLSGRWHEVHSGVCIIFEGEVTVFSQVTKVHFMELDSSTINWYVDTKEPMDKAGAYGIQGYGAVLVDRVDGDFYNVMGFPISKIMSELARLNIYDARAL